MAEVKLPRNPKWIKAMCDLYPREILERSEKLYPACKLLLEGEKEKEAGTVEVTTEEVAK